VAPPAGPVVHGALSHGPASAGAPLPPADAGGSRTTLSGCLLAADEAAAARFPPPPVTRTGGAAAVTLKAVAGGVLVEHSLSHACCLKAKVSTGLAGRTATVLTQLSGTPCRCMCGSTLRTAVSLPPGAWSVAVDLEEGGARHQVHRQEIQVR
jgi:hypothetical protein